MKNSNTEKSFRRDESGSESWLIIREVETSLFADKQEIKIQKYIEYRLTNYEV